MIIHSFLTQIRPEIPHTKKNEIFKYSTSNNTYIISQKTAPQIQIITLRQKRDYTETYNGIDDLSY